jgi:starch synthase (maltosyl-transferring)
MPKKSSPSTASSPRDSASARPAETWFGTTGRYAIEDVQPVIALGRRAVKAVVGELIQVSASVFREGHDEVGAHVVLTEASGRTTQIRMEHGPSDTFTAWIQPQELGDAVFQIEAWGDPLGTWIHRAEIKIPAQIDVELELREGELLYSTALKGLPRGKVRDPLKAAVAALKDSTRPPLARLAAATAPDVIALLRAYPVREHVTSTQSFPIMVERERALYGSWYEFFPRSEGASLDPPISGTFATAKARLDAAARMGFDVVYLPPIHPIGRAHRKGRNNSLDAGPDDPGSPWGIGSSDGGHDAIHPDLGTEADFIDFVAHAKTLGLEIALDLALQCSPDHPWVTEHPQWFSHRADGTIAYAENPPKKYQDIYPLYFDADPDGLFTEVERVVRHWMRLGIRIFRVDNPHTKPVAFWERLFASIRRTDPDVIFLAEAFTKPTMMKLLGEIGFQQSYTYFTWRNERAEIEDYFRELSGPSAASMRPNAFVNTPDILPTFLQYGGPPAFAIRATLAATLSPSWGVYAGYELFEHVAVRPGSEEYLDSEKYEYKPRDWQHADQAGSTLAPYLTRLNQWRREHPALRRLRNLVFHSSSNERLVTYSKREGDDVILVVCTVDPYAVREGVLDLNMPALGLDWADTFVARDLVTGQVWAWDRQPYVRLDPHQEVAHIIHVTGRS